MTYVITEPCIDEKDASCVEVCPVDCIHAQETDEQYYIDPRRCIDCGACLPVCPVHAIYEDFRVPPPWQSYIAKNAAYFNVVPINAVPTAHEPAQQHLANDPPAR